MNTKDRLCLICGTQNNLTFHHLTARTLEYEKKKGMKSKIKKITLCRDCHDLVEYEKHGMKWNRKLEKTWKKAYQEGFDDCMSRGIEN